MSQISQWYWRIPELGFRALRLRREYVLALMIGSALLAVLGVGSSPVFAEDCDGAGSPGSC